MRNIKSNNNESGNKGTGPTRSFDGSVIGPGRQIGPFRIERELGRGGAGVVYLAHDTKLDRSVAIKSVPAELADNLAAQSRFLREAKLLASLNHPNIAAIHEELEEAEGAVYLVLEYVPGQTLGERIAKGGLTLKETLSIACEIAEAISYAHEKGVIHRDLKPGNIKITPEGGIKVLDLGIAKMIGAPSPATATITEPGQVIGTPGYMSPEQARGNPADHRTDIWSFGCILYEMLTGICPFPGPTASEALASILKTDPDWRLMPTEAGADLREIIHKCLEKDPAQRYQSASALCADLHKSKEALTAQPSKPVDLKALLQLLRKPRIEVYCVLVFLMLCLAVLWRIHRKAKINWARLEALPQIMKLIEQEKFVDAFSLARDAERYIATDPILVNLWSQMSREYSITTVPAGADVYCREHPDFDGEREYIGKSPIVNIKHPFGVFRWEVEKEGFETRECVAYVYPAFPKTLTILLQQEHVNPGMLPISIPDSGRCLIDKYEVTNEQFQKFVDAGGYAEEKYWKHKFVEDGREIGWGDAMKRFVDRTNRPGPATWEGGTFPRGQEGYPVSGISWYEAAAYAEFADKDLPVYALWKHAASPDMFSIITPYSSFGKEVAPVGKHRGTGLFGLYDAAGNVKEWCWNATDDSGSQRYILGGSWADREYMFASSDVRPPMNREVTNGFRCARYDGGIESLEDEYTVPKKRRSARDFAAVPRIPDEEFRIYRDTLYGYTQAELNASRTLVDDASPHWRKEKIEFDAAYGDDKVTAYLFLPTGVNPPYQSVVYFPGVGTQYAQSSVELKDFDVIDFVIKSGRAVLYPVYKGTYERRFDKKPRNWEWSNPSGHLEWARWLAKDLGRSIDYLELRAKEQDDIDMDKLTYIGFSWGAWIGPVMLAVEERIKFGVFVAGGFVPLSFDPAMDPTRYAPLVDVPILMVNGVHDGFFPLETSAEPMYEFLGSTDKESMVYDGGHGMLGLFLWQVRDDVLKWMDEHLGPVD